MPLIKQETGVTIGLVVVMLGAYHLVFSGINNGKQESKEEIAKYKEEWSIQKQQLQTSIDSMDRKLGNAIEAMNRRDATDATFREAVWSKQEMAEWAARMQILNPTLRIIDPRNPNRLMAVPDPGVSRQPP